MSSSVGTTSAVPPSPPEAVPGTTVPSETTIPPAGPVISGASLVGSALTTTTGYTVATYTPHPASTPPVQFVDELVVLVNVVVFVQIVVLFTVSSIAVVRFLIFRVVFVRVLVFV